MPSRCFFLARSLPPFFLPRPPFLSLPAGPAAPRPPPGSPRSGRHNRPSPHCGRGGRPGAGRGRPCRPFDTRARRRAREESGAWARCARSKTRPPRGLRRLVRGHPELGRVCPCLAREDSSVRAHTVRQQNNAPLALSPSLALLSKTRSLKTHSNGSSRSPTGTPPCRRPSGCGPAPAPAPSTGAGRSRGRAWWAKGRGVREGGVCGFLLVPPGGQPHPLPLSLFLTSSPSPAPSQTCRPCPRQPPGRQHLLLLVPALSPLFCRGTAAVAAARPRRRGGAPAHWWWPRPAAAVEVVGPFRQRPAALAFCFSSSQIGRPSRPGRTWRAGPAWAGRPPPRQQSRLCPQAGWQPVRRRRRRCRPRRLPPRGASFWPSKEQVTWRTGHRARLGGCASARQGRVPGRCRVGAGGAIAAAQKTKCLLSPVFVPHFFLFSPPSFSLQTMPPKKKPTLPAAAGDRISCPGAQT